MKTAKLDSAEIEFEVLRVPGGVSVRIELGGVKASGVISTTDARTLASALKFTAALPVPPPKPKLSDQRNPGAPGAGAS